MGHWAPSIEYFHNKILHISLVVKNGNMLRSKFWTNYDLQTYSISRIEIYICLFLFTFMGEILNIQSSGI